MTRQELLEVRKAWQRDAARVYERARNEYADNVQYYPRGSYFSRTVNLQKSAAIYYKIASG